MKNKRGNIGFGAFITTDDTRDLNEITEMARHGKTMREIAEFLDPDNIEQVLRELETKHSELWEAFQLGIASQGPETKLLSAQAELEVIKLKRTQKVDRMIADFLGEEEQ